MKEEKETCCVCEKEINRKCGSCGVGFCNKHYTSVVMTGNCCIGSEQDYGNNTEN